jgi:ABC-2 type transport system permease protein
MIAVIASLERVWSLSLRYTYLLRGSWPRLLELAYWPAMQIVLWGFITLFFREQSSIVAQAFGVLLGAVMLWDLMFRGQLGVSICFFEEMWSRNLGNLFVSPLRPWEMIAALLAMSLVRTLIGMLPASLLTIWFFGFSIYSLGWPLLAFFVNLMAFGWAIGLAVSGLVLRVGLGAETLAWALIFAIAPVSAVYYPVSVLPVWLQAAAWTMPPAYVFEGMRGVMLDGHLRADLLIGATGLNLLYLGAGCLAFLLFFRSGRINGKLLQIGE